MDTSMNKVKLTVRSSAGSILRRPPLVGRSARPLPDVFPNGNYQTGDA